MARELGRPSGHRPDPRGRGLVEQRHRPTFKGFVVCSLLCSFSVTFRIRVRESSPSVVLKGRHHWGWGSVTRAGRCSRGSGQFVQWFGETTVLASAVPLCMQALSSVSPQGCGWPRQAHPPLRDATPLEGRSEEAAHSCSHLWAQCPACPLLSRDQQRAVGSPRLHRTYDGAGPLCREDKRQSSAGGGGRWLSAQHAPRFCDVTCVLSLSVIDVLSGSLCSAVRRRCNALFSKQTGGMTKLTKDRHLRTCV